MADIKFEIQSQLGSISESPKGWKKELNLISWNDKRTQIRFKRMGTRSSENGKGSNSY